MRVKVLTLQFASSLGGFDDRPLADFIRDKELLEVREHFFIVHDQPHLACLVAYQDQLLPRTQSTTIEPTREQRRPAPKSDELEIAPESRALFGSLREWRSTQARIDGVPPYVIATNRQLAAIIDAKPATANALAAIVGIGAGKVERYGARILALLNGEPAATGTAP